ncbi:hypothetical protein ABT275_39340 [Streptomyces sp. NPDC001185]|uniref:hypothetical protein n=1 Tax=Streptomyces sp. NPDC001185 TaxID=3154380 RepID=UPI003323C253
MNDFVSAAETPHFETAVIERGARRKRATAIAGIATALVVAGGAGTALAAGAVGGSGSHTSEQTVASTAADSTAADSTLLVRTSGGKTVKVQLAGVTAAKARAALVHLHVPVKFTGVQTPDCKKQNDQVVAVSPNAPTVVHAGDMVSVKLCHS